MKRTTLIINYNRIH